MSGAHGSLEEALLHSSRADFDVSGFCERHGLGDAKGLRFCTCDSSDQL